MELAMVDIKQEHIDQGAPGDPDKCALALALLDAGYRNPHIKGSYVIAVAPGAEYDRLYRMESGALEFIHNFDGVKGGRRLPAGPRNVAPGGLALRPDGEVEGNADYWAAEMLQAWKDAELDAEQG